MKNPLRRPTVKPPMPDFTDEPAMTRDPVALELNMTGGHRNLINTPEGVWAFYVMGEEDWQHRSSSHRTRLLSGATHRWAELTGHEIYLRGVTSPFAHKAYASRLYGDHPDRLDDVEGARSFRDLVDAAQIHALRLEARKSSTILGVRLSDDTVPDTHLAQLFSADELTDRHGTLEPLRRKLRSITKSVSREGFSAKPINARALGWLIHASVGIGAPVPAAVLGSSRDGWPNDTIPGFTNPVYPTASPYAPTVTVRTLRDSKTHTAHVAILHAEEWADRAPDHAQGPWLGWLNTLDFTVDWCIRGVVMPGNELASTATVDRRRALNIASHHEEHGDDAPPKIKRGITRARLVEDEVTSGRREIATRIRGVVMFAVHGPTEDDALELASTLTVEAADKQGLTLTHDYGQFAYYRALTPGEPCPMSGHITQMPAYFLATAVPNASVSGGDPTGLLVGNIGGGHDVFVFDPFGGARRDKSNVVAMGGDQGAGKSSTAGAMMDFTATCGIRTVGYDPSGPWAELTKMPHLRDNARHLDLSSARPGTLVPHLMIPEPRQGDYDTPEEYTAAVAEAKSERMELCIDAFRDLLPHGLVVGDMTGRVVGTIEESVTHIGGAYGTDPWKIVDHMEGLSDDGRNIARHLRARAELKDGALVFPAPGRDVDEDYVSGLMNQAVLTIITMGGLTLPPKDQPDRALWSRQAQRSVPIVNLGTRFATRVIYADKNPKAIWSDELGISTGGASAFSSFITRSSYDSRKWSALIGLLFQNPNILTSIDEQISNLLGSVWIGRMDENAARAAQPLLRLPENAGYDQEILSLEQGEFLIRHWDSLDRVRRVRVDRDWWHEDLRAALNTTPGGRDTYDESMGADIFGGVA